MILVLSVPLFFIFSCSSLSFPLLGFLVYLIFSAIKVFYLLKLLQSSFNGVRFQIAIKVNLSLSQAFLSSFLFFSQFIVLYVFVASVFLSSFSFSTSTLPSLIFRPLFILSLCVSFILNPESFLSLFPIIKSRRKKVEEREKRKNEEKKREKKKKKKKKVVLFLNIFF